MSRKISAVSSLRFRSYLDGTTQLLEILPATNTSSVMQQKGISSI